MDNKQRADAYRVRTTATRLSEFLNGVYQKATVEVIRISDDDVIRTSDGDKGETDFFE